MRTRNSGFSTLFKDPEFTSRIIAVILDEAHCISQWGSFRPEYRELGRLQSVLPNTIFHITSATLPSHLLTDVLRVLKVSRNNLYTVHRSNDRTNVALVVREIKSSLTSFDDLEFLVHGWASGGPPPPRFLILFDSIKESVAAGHKLRSRLTESERDKILWHNSDMSSDFRSKVLEAFRRKEVIGFCATDTLGMVSLYDYIE